MSKNVILELDEEPYLPFARIKASGRWPVPHPIPYQGSKRNLAKTILGYFPDKFDRLVEPFAGSAAISLAAAYRGYGQQFILNDAHEPLAALWQEIVDHPDGLADAYEELWNDQRGRERKFFDRVRTQFNKRPQPCYFLYLLARCVKAAIRYNSKGQFNNSPDNRRNGAIPATMRRRIKGASELLRGRTQISSADYLTILESCKATDLIYLDPPYQGVCGSRDQRYASKIDHATFCDALSMLNDRGCIYALSYDGRIGSKKYGVSLPKQLGLVHIEIEAGRSSQATLLRRKSETVESLYLSPALVSNRGDFISTCPSS